MDFPVGSDGKAWACNAEHLGSIPGLGRSPGEGNGNPLQYYCLENPMDRGTWWATVHGVAKSWTRLSDFISFSVYIFLFFLFFLFLYFTILYWFCHTSTCICHGCTHVPNPEPPSHLPPHTIPLGHPSAPAPHATFFIKFIHPDIKSVFNLPI